MTSPDVPILKSPAAGRPGLIRIGTRGSRLAVSQTSDVARAIAAATGAEVALVIVKTHGDVVSTPLSQLGGTGVFVSALRDALLSGECDLAVHSLKDLPTAPVPGIALAAIPERADARDVLISSEGMPLTQLRRGAAVGTGSPRRVAQLRARRPDLDVHDLRGNIDTRIGRVGHDLDAVVLAAAGLDRLGRADEIAERFPLEEVPTAPGQGALAVETPSDRLSDPLIARAIASIDHSDTRAAALAERALLARLDAGCAAPVGARARRERQELVLTGAVYRPEDGKSLEVEVREHWPEGSSASDELVSELGNRAAEELFAAGAADLAPLGGRQ